MTVLLAIGDFSRMTHLSIKALRHYHEVGLLEPADVDPSSGYRRYDSSQVAVAQVIKRFRDLGMPLDEVKAILEAPDVPSRNTVIVAHLERMEGQLEETRATVASLRRVLEAPATTPHVEYRTVGATLSLAIRQTVTAGEIEAWWFGAFEELRAALQQDGVRRAGPDACLYPGEIFEVEEGQMVAYVPFEGRAAISGRVELAEVPAVELAVMVHDGPYDDLDRSYGALGTYVSERALGVDGPIREHYLVGPFDADSPDAFRTELGWPVFRTAGA